MKKLKFLLIFLMSLFAWSCERSANDQASSSNSSGASTAIVPSSSAAHSKAATQNHLSMKIDGVLWQADSEIFGAFHPKGYDRAIALLDDILDEIGEDEKHPMADLADAISVFVEKYEAEHVPVSGAKPGAVLKFLMREHGLRQSDLPEIGSQGVVSEVLSDKRDLNARQIKRLAKRFGVSPAVFI